MRCSFRTTSAARVSAVEVVPVAISAIVRIEQGAITMPRVRNEPEAIARADVGGRVGLVRERLDLGGLEVELVGERELGRAAHAQVALEAELAAGLQQAHAVDRARTRR